MSEEESKPRPVSEGFRASDEDRERLISELNDHTVAGRLTTEELEERLESAYAARTTSELDALRRDLPLTPRQTALSHAARRSHLTRRLIQETGGSLSLFVLCTGVWVASGAHGQFWPVWLLIIVVMSVGRSGWALFGPAPDLDAVEQHLDRRRQRRLDERNHHHHHQHHDHHGHGHGDDNRLDR
jgi:hypothetical protein